VETYLYSPIHLYSVVLRDKNEFAFYLSYLPLKYLKVYKYIADLYMISYMTSAKFLFKIANF